ncbi:MAG: translation elongation factor Ts [Patescibacteria group bacterium]
MAVTIDQIKNLRDSTGVSMTACKSALEEADGDFEKAIEVLRKKGEAKAADRSARSTGQGAIVVKSEGTKTAMVQLSCETDFVAISEEFLKLAESFADKLLSGQMKVENRDLADVQDAILKMGENVQIGNMALVEGAVIGEYVHSNRRIGALVALDGGTKELAKDIAMHASATNPKFTKPEEVSEELLAKEREIWTEQLKTEGKPAEIVEKIIVGKEKKFREESSLLTQAFIKDPEKTVEQLLKDAGATLKSFVRFGF